MKSIFKPSNLIFGVFLILLLIPKTRSFIQVNLNKIVFNFKTVHLIDSIDQKKAIYSGQLTGINTIKNSVIKDLKGKVVFVNFWATWCPPCIAEMQSLQDLYSEYKNEIVFLFITNEGNVVTKSFLQKHNYTIPCYNNAKLLSVDFEHTEIPMTYILNKQGKMVVKHSGALNWNTKSIHEILDKLVKE